MHALQDVLPVTHVTIDEVHNLSVFQDVLMGLLKHHMRQNQQIRIILMSAAADCKVLSEFFKDEKTDRPCEILIWRDALPLTSKNTAWMIEAASLMYFHRLLTVRQQI